MQTQILGLVTPLMALFFAATFVVFWRVGRLKRHVLGFGIAYALSAVGFLITHFSPGDAVYVFHATQLFYALGSIVLLASVCERAGKPLHLPSMAVVYVITALTMGLAVSFSNDVGPRLVIVNMGYGVMFAMGVTTLLSARRRDAFDIAIIAIMAFQTADFLVRPSLTLLFERSIPAEVYRDSIYYSLIGLVLGVKGVTTGMVLIGAAIAEWTAALRENSERDPLSGLRNRGSFEQSIRALLSRAQTEGRPLSLVVADIDHFKQVNDIWGHQAGDQAISNIGRLIDEMIREGDTAGRIGGEEFCIAIWNCENDPALRLAERIRLAFMDIQHSGLSEDIRLTASFGVATAREGESYEKLFARADTALYMAKSNGRNRVENAGERRREEAVPDQEAKPVELNRAAAG
ncbi:diguanylate cyclase (GGDEF) domain-containing protein [Parasphingorhabdus marina DSM 22363]|uniref:diguanylate cyclase n=1 Tax=Parasphingorhabdus marina DSM 22363 TaxID=1123272 RepID=A0A1N6FJY5_9SPHN|nr:GGDEF domain-containing protein [Parasphingorhabdus marina]SIN95572.1 diguanylate cyclase (GGDEF) domain-containing protein [Parasphingorhabdus marina DSM 22363]